MVEVGAQYTGELRASLRQGDGDADYGGALDETYAICRNTVSLRSK